MLLIGLMLYKTLIKAFYENYAELDFLTGEIRHRCADFLHLELRATEFSSKQKNPLNSITKSKSKVWIHSQQIQWNSQSFVIVFLFLDIGTDVSNCLQSTIHC